jgi:hypothetical protein
LYHHVEAHFRQFLGELELLPIERQNAEGKALRIAKSLFTRYYSETAPFDPTCYAVVGSYGKNVAARPRTDIDMIFVMPPAELLRFEGVVWNRQSYLLQEVKDALLGTFWNTDIKGDGPVVKVPFDSYKVEVVPCFAAGDGLFLNAHTKEGGRWAISSPRSELAHLDRTDAASNGMARHLIRMLKAWKQTCNVEIRSVCLEIVAVVFLDQWANSGKEMVYYDFMVRDFFEFLLRHRVGGWAKPAGINEHILMGDCWQSKADSAYARACKACDYEKADDAYCAVDEWKKIFGNQFHHAQSETISYLAGLL